VTGSRFGRHVTAVMAEQPFRFTLESEAVPDPAWHAALDELVALDRECDRISIERTPAVVRKTARGRTPEGEAPTALLDAAEAAPEPFRLDLSKLGGEARLRAGLEVDFVDEIARVLVGDPPTKLSRSKRDGIERLAIHARHHRDVFVTTDSATLAKRDSLATLGIRVEDPPAALSLARERCAKAD
jgi:hypothetical protein